MRQTVAVKKEQMQMFIPILTVMVFLGFALLIGSAIVLSIIPIYLGNISVEKTRFILTTVQLNNYTLSMNPSIGKRDLNRAISITNLTFEQAQMTMNSSIQYALEQQLQAGDIQDRFIIQISQITPYTDNSLDMSVMLNLMIVYTKECVTCDRRRQLVISRQLCSNNRLANAVQFLVNSTNLTYTLSNPVIVYSSYIPIDSIIVVTRVLSSSQPNNSTAIDETIRISNRLLASGYILTVTTTKTNYIATLDEVGTQTSARPNDGPVVLLGATTMYPGIIQTIERQTQLSNTSIASNITINNISLYFWYSNSTVQVLLDLLWTFSTSCDSQCNNQRSIQLNNQLRNLTNIPIHIQPSNLTDGQVRLSKNGTSVLYTYSLTTQVISNLTGTISLATPPTMTIIY